MKHLTPHAKLAAVIMLSSLLASIGLVGGLGLQLVKKDLVAFLPLLIALPAINAISGNYATLTAAHLTDPENYRKRTYRLILALFISLPFCTLGIAAMSIGVAALKDFEITRQLAFAYVQTIGLMLYIVVTIMFVLIVLAKRLIEAVHANTDDILLPIANTLASVLTITAIAIVATRFS